MSAIDEVKQRLDIVDVAGGYLRLDKAGRNFKALCPFHEEKTPSFFVFPDKQSWRCFGCGAGGDIVSFVMKKEGIDFSEALKMLAERAGVTLIRKKLNVEDKLSDRLYRVNEAAAEYYNNVLLNDPAAEHARSYVNKRGLDRKAIDIFQIGFSKSEGLKKHLINSGFKESELLTVGLLGEKEGRTYDYFRNRLMFPIRDFKGKTVGFGARALDESLPKYLNSPQTTLFDKSGILYGIDRAKSAIREKGMVVIVEGYMDAIAAHQHGVANVVASMGTALTEKQMRILRGLTKNLVFALDPDAAGEAATSRGVDIARYSLDRQDLTLPYLFQPTSDRKSKIKQIQALDPDKSSLLTATSRLKADIKIMLLPEGKDPDALIREDPGEWQRLVDKALPIMDYLIEQETSKADVTKPEGRSQASEKLLPLIAELDDEVQREFYLGKLAGLLGVNERTLIGMAARLHRTRSEKGKRSDAKPIAASRSGDPLEEYCLALLLQHPELRVQADSLLPEHFERSENREVFTAWRDASNPDDMFQMIDIDLEEQLGSLRSRTLPPADYPVWEKALADCIGRLEERRLRLYEQFITSEDVPRVNTGDLDSVSLATIQKRTVDVDSRLTRSMQERTEPSIINREG